MGDIIKSKNDSRNYNHINLPNGIKVIIIIDNNSQKSAVSMAINTGYYEDPDNYQGLAHFLEHMLFMGTSKYPSVDYFMKFINTHGGSTNAYTSHNITNYYYDVLPEYLDQSLDIFSQFFINPLFNVDTVNKEIDAVNSEHNKNIQSPSWRLMRMIKELANKDSLYHKFGTGNKETLKKSDIREKLIDFYNKNYIPKNMTLVILTNLPYDNVINSIHNKFNKIGQNNNTNNNNTSNAITYIPPFNFKGNNDIMCQKYVLADSSDNRDILYLLYPVDNIKEHFVYKPYEYINILISNKGNNTPIHILKSIGFVNRISFQIFDSDDYVNIIGMVIELTDKGCNNINYISNLIHDYIEYILNKPLDYVFYDMKEINDIEFKYIQQDSPMDTVVNINANMDIYPIEYVLYGPYYYKDFRYDIIKNIISKLTRNNCIIILSSNKNTEFNNTEMWYGIKYSLINTPPFIKSDINIVYSLPKKNIYIPKLNSITTVSSDISPIKIYDNFNIYYRRSSFDVDRVVMGWNMYNNYIYSSLHNYTACILFVNILSDMLEQDIYYANLANTYFGIDIKQNTLSMYINTYSSNLDKILQYLIDIIYEKVIDEDVFNRTKKYLKKRIASLKYKSPYIQVMDYFKKVVYDRYYNFIDIIGIIDSISIDNIYKVRDNLKGDLKEHWSELLFYGNISLDMIDSIVKSHKDLFSGKAQVKHSNIIEAHEGDEEIYIRKSFNINDNNSAVLIFFEFGNINISDNINWEHKYNHLLVIDSILKDKFFNKLRSEEQLGYIVKTFIGSPGNIKNPKYGIYFLIQSDKYPTYILRNKIKQFIKDSYNDILNINQDNLNKHKSSVISKLNKECDNLYEEFKKFYDIITRGINNFNYRRSMIDYMNSVNINSLENMYKRYLLDRHTRIVRIIEYTRTNKN